MEIVVLLGIFAVPVVFFLFNNKVEPLIEKIVYAFVVNNEKKKSKEYRASNRKAPYRSNMTSSRTHSTNTRKPSALQRKQKRANMNNSAPVRRKAARRQN